MYGKSVDVYTDHQPLVTWKSTRNPSNRLNRIMLKIQQFDYKLIYKPGIKNVNADLLSRLENNESTVINSIVFDQLIDWSLEQNKDPILFKIKQHIREKTVYDQIENIYKTFLTIWSNLQINGEILMLCCVDKTVIVLPRHLINRILNELHGSNESGHFSGSKTII